MRKRSDHYIMCASAAGRAGAMGLYPWIITRRYAIADEYQCKEDTDCDEGEFCDKGTVTVGRNRCVSLRSEEAACSRDGQCDTGMKCQGKPVGKCIFEASVGLNGDCIKDAQCTTGSCNSDGVCQCSSNNHCGDGRYCDMGGLLGAGRNTCVALRAENDNCSADDQCRSPAICKGKPAGRCVTESSVPLNGACTRDAQCLSGSCSTDRVCQCKDNPDCGQGRYCDTGSLGVGRNTCVALRAENDNCSADDQCRSPAICKGKPAGRCVTESSVPLNGACTRDDQCLSGSCSTDRVCQCKDNPDCGVGRYCDTGSLGVGRNTCVTARGRGESCSADKQCGAGLECKGIVGFMSCK